MHSDRSGYSDARRPNTPLLNRYMPLGTNCATAETMTLRAPLGTRNIVDAHDWSHHPRAVRRSMRRPERCHRAMRRYPHPLATDPRVATRTGRDTTEAMAAHQLSTSRRKAMSSAVSAVLGGSLEVCRDL